MCLTLCVPETPLNFGKHCVDPDEKSHNVAFHQDLHCLLRQNRSSEKEIQYFLEIITCDPSVSTMNYTDLTVSNFMENSIGTMRVKQLYNINKTLSNTLLVGTVTAENTARTFISDCHVIKLNTQTGKAWVYCKFGNFHECFIFAKLRICKVS